MLTVIAIAACFLGAWGTVFGFALVGALRDEISALTAQRISKGVMLPPPPPLPRELRKNRAQRRAEGARRS